MKFLTKMSQQKSWIIVCFLNFLIASLMGLLMRFFYLFPVKNVNYSFLLHGHSHVAMLGWTYLMIYVLIVSFFIPKHKSSKPIYNQLFWLTEFSVIGMMIAFPVQGYALFSIIFSTLHIILSYIFCWLVWRDCCKGKRMDKKLLLGAILFMLFSTIGIWCLGAIISLLGKQSILYQIAIQFFLHFQFNGWFLFAVLALFLKQFKNEIEISHFKVFFTLLIFSTIATVAFPVSWYVKNNVISVINGIGVVLQLLAFIYFYKMLKPQISWFKTTLNTTAKRVYSLAICSLVLKVMVQLLLLFPDIVSSSHQIRGFVIGFIHLTTLGIITGFLLGILFQNNLLSGRSSLVRSGVQCFVFGYVFTEIILFFQGGLFYFGKGLLPAYYESIFGASVLIVLGLVLIIASEIKIKKIRVD
ncbi:hypothetical protein ACIDC4_00500 [Flavobacterium sp. C3NV]